MDLLRNLFGNLTSGIIRLAVTAGMLCCSICFIVKPVLKTTTDAIHSTGLDQIGKSLEGVSTEIKREVHRSFEVTKPHGGQPARSWSTASSGRTATSTGSNAAP